MLTPLKGGNLELALELCFSVENPGLTLLVYAHLPAERYKEINIFAKFLDAKRCSLWYKASDKVQGQKVVNSIQ